MAHPVTTTEIADGLTRWFQTTELAGLKLPTGWFGKPGDNQYRLASVSGDTARLTITLDGDEVLTVEDPAGVEATHQSFAIAASGTVSFEWGYDSGPRHRRQFDHGTVEFVRLVR
jgi:hypothetical protein